MQLLTQIIRLLLVMVPNQKRMELHEDEVKYTTLHSTVIQEPNLETILQKVPLP